MLAYTILISAIASAVIKFLFYIGGLRWQQKKRYI
jgi:hypothetical protein